MRAGAIRTPRLTKLAVALVALLGSSLSSMPFAYPVAHGADDAPAVPAGTSPGSPDLAVTGAANVPAGGSASAAATRCIAFVAYAEAAGEGVPGLAAVVRVIRNRMADPRFPSEACAVVTQPGEFQPVAESARLRLALVRPAEVDPATALADFGLDPTIFTQAQQLAALDPGGQVDPTSGALYFVNPRFMEPDKCAWFAGLKRTSVIGAHVFMTHYRPGEAVGGPALDCAEVARDWAAYVKARPAKRSKSGRRRINPAWLVEVQPSGMARGSACSAGAYDPVTRTMKAAPC